LRGADFLSALIIALEAYADGQTTFAVVFRCLSS